MTGKWVTKLAERVMHYSKVMDVLAQYHPEYTALAWGAMKIILMVVVPLFPRACPLIT